MNDGVGCRANILLSMTTSATRRSAAIPIWTCQMLSFRHRNQSLLRRGRDSSPRQNCSYIDFRDWPIASDRTIAVRGTSGQTEEP